MSKNVCLQEEVRFNVYGGNLDTLHEQAELRLEEFGPGRAWRYALDAAPTAYNGAGEPGHWEATVVAHADPAEQRKLEAERNEVPLPDHLR